MNNNNNNNSFNNNFNNKIGSTQPYLSDNARNALFEGKDSNRRFGGGGNNNNNHDTLSNQDIFEKQRRDMEEQDKMLDSLSGSITRVKDIAITIDKTAQQQTEMLDELDVHVDSTSARMRNTTKNLITLTKQSKTTGYWSVICFLLLVLLVVIILASVL
ncbi:hypothetical protein RB653_002336 [Dictyostelium firmibasis]|uniref:t-SNARE coiled-coil homology domain-containing protein n=1 Tax=Dictyostelium firmibasis TaxID=79012 RepID=A0AAN7U2T6_9MYCE